MERIILAIFGRNWRAKCLCCSWESGRADMRREQAIYRAKLHKSNRHARNDINLTAASWPRRVIYVERTR